MGRTAAENPIASLPLQWHVSEQAALLILDAAFDSSEGRSLLTLTLQVTRNVTCPYESNLDRIKTCTSHSVACTTSLGAGTWLHLHPYVVLHELSFL